MKRLTVTLLGFGLLCFGMGGRVLADELVETFDDPFGDWTTRWLYENSNLHSYYHATGNCDINYRGNNACGIWMADCQECGCGVGGNQSTIEFEPDFAATIQHIEFDLSSWNATRLVITDQDGGVLLDVNNPVQTRNQCAGHQYGVDSNNGVGSIRVEGSGQVEGNNAMDNFKLIVGGGNCQYSIKKSKAKRGCETCPKVGSEYKSEQGCEVKKDCKKRVKTRINCPEGPGTCKIKARRKACG